jgi:hypothetical protein
MIIYPLNLVSDAPDGVLDVKLTPYEAGVLKEIAVDFQQKNGVLPFKIRTIPGGTYEFRRENGVKMEDVFDKTPAKLVIQLGLILELCGKITENPKKEYRLGFDNARDLGRIRQYASRSGQKVSIISQKSGHVLIKWGKKNDYLPVADGMRRGLRTFQTEGNDNYIRQRVSSLNCELGTSYRVRKISTGVFCVTLDTARDNSDLERGYRLFLAMPTQENADALIEAARGMVQR